MAIALDAGAERSRWAEFDAGGQRLLREAGTLRRVQAEISGRCAQHPWSVALAQARGGRDYDGSTSTGAALRTLSSIDRQELVFTVARPLDERWSAGLRGAVRRTGRDIASTAVAAGYPERHTDGFAALGLRARLPYPEPGVAWAEAWAGAGPPGRMDLQLPGLDPATLKLGALRTLQASVHAQREFAAGDGGQWQWQAALALRVDRTAAGPGALLTRHGLPAGGAAQPRIEQQSWSLQAGVGYRFR